MIQLRPYQQRAIEDIRAQYHAGKRAPLFVLPTGGGKTVCFSYMVASAVSRGQTVWVLAHRAELLGQISRTLVQFGVRHGLIAPGMPGDREAPVQVASVFTLVRRLDRYPAPTLIICDEAHHAVAKSSWGAIFQKFPQAKRLGVSATPCRLSGEGLGELFDCMVQGPTLAELIAIGALSPYRLFAPAGEMDLSGLRSRGGDYMRDELAAAVDKPTITGSALTHYQKLAAGKRAVAFCVSVEHAQHVAAQFAAAGIPSASVDGAMDGDTRAKILSDFAAGTIKLLTSCDLISEGFDVPAIEAAILLRPTQSLALYLQQVGRALRLFEGKTHAIILDHANNCARHGLPDDARLWSLDGTGKKTGSKATEVPVKSCPACFATVMAQATACSCGHTFVVKPRTLAEVEGELVEVELKRQAAAAAELAAERDRLDARRAQGRARTEAELVAFATSKGYARPHFWARQVMLGRLKRTA